MLDLSFLSLPETYSFYTENEVSKAIEITHVNSVYG